MKLKNIDLLKGILIILVIIGHILQGTLEENIFRHIIYSFHMPLFIGVSGFLLNTSRINRDSLATLFEKYKYRIIIPWIIAVVVYAIVINWNNIGTSTFIIIFTKSFVLPYYHLWFIPAFASWILLTWIAKKLKVADGMLLIISFAISILTYIIDTYELYQSTPLISSGLKILLYTFRPYFYVFFVLGIFLRSKNLEGLRTISSVTLLISFITIVVLFYYKNLELSIVSFFILNFSLLIILLNLSRRNLLPHSNKLEWVGENSLGIYLWHVLIILLFKIIYLPNHIALFYLVTSLSQVIFIDIVYKLTHINLLNKYLFGFQITKNTKH